MNINKEILKTIKYFSFFAYQPTLEEIHTFLRVKISKKELKAIFRHTPPQYSIGRKISNIKYQISKRKLQNWCYRIYINLLSFFPQIKLVGLSGSIAMMNATENDDIDLFIITSRNRLFTGRFIALVFAQLLGLRRERNSAIGEKARYRKFFDGKQKTAKNLVSSLSPKNKVCLNLFFDESNLKVPKFKQTKFVGHEVLQMKPIINKNYTYEKFLEANKWVFELFPNAKSQINYKYYSGVIPVKTGIQTKITIFKMKLIDWIPSYEGMTRLFGTWNLGFKVSNNVEKALKSFQLTFINRHKTTEIITNSQLWFHPDDFGKKIFTDY